MPSSPVAWCQTITTPCRVDELHPCSMPSEEVDMAEDKWVQMTHPTLNDPAHKPARVTETAYINVWKPRGWKLAKKKEA